jgi:transcriptional regulator with XRE-family HTH domain
MIELEIKSLDELSDMTKIDIGSLSRYFSQERRPSIDAIEPICIALKVTSDELLIALGAKSRSKEIL